MAQSDIITAQYVHIDETAASIGDRILARGLDYLCAFIYLLGVDVFFVEYVEVSSVLVMILLNLPAVFYSFLCETFLHGQTLGKRVRHLRVIRIDGAPPTVGDTFLRWMFLLVDFWMSGIGLVAIAVTRRQQRFGDLAAGTMVIHLDDYARWHQTLDEFYYLRPNYRVTYPQAEDLTTGQADLLRRTLFAPSGYDEAKVKLLADRVATALHVTPKEQPADFLTTLLRDYHYYEL